MVAKTVYDTYWKPSLVTGLVFVVAASAVMYVPYYLKVPVFVAPWIAVVCQIGLCIVVTLFFYSGISFAKQFRVTMLMYSGVALFGILSNLFYQATYLVSNKLLTTDYVVAGLINLSAIALTMSCYRISHKKIEVTAEDEAKVLQPERDEKLAPVVCALPVIASVVLMTLSPHIPNGAIFAVNLPFFICTQLLISFWSSFFFFKEKTRGEKIHLGLTILSIALALGALGNQLHHLTALRPGLRVALNSTEFIIMNAGAAIIVLVVVNWKKGIAEKKAKRAKLIEAQTATAAAEAPVPPPEAVATPKEIPEIAETTEAPLKVEQPQDSKTV